MSAQVKKVYATASDTESMSPRQMVEWVNGRLKAQFTKVGELRSGADYCLLTNMIFKDAIPMKKVIRSSRLTDWRGNWEMLRDAWKIFGVEKEIPVESLIQGNRKVSLKFLQWFKKLYDANYDGPDSVDISHEVGLPADVEPGTSMRPLTLAPSTALRFESNSQTTIPSFNEKFNYENILLHILKKIYGQNHIEKIRNTCRNALKKCSDKQKEDLDEFWKILLKLKSDRIVISLPESAISLAEYFFQMGHLEASSEFIWHFAHLLLKEFIQTQQLEVKLYSHESKRRFVKKISYEISQMFQVFEELHRGFYSNKNKFNFIESAFETAIDWMSIMRITHLSEQKKRELESVNFNKRPAAIKERPELFFDNLIIGSADALIAAYPRIENTETNHYVRYELDYIL